jgi:hypothetical protein
MGASNCTPELPCGGQSCIVARRTQGNSVHEDIVFDKQGAPRRSCCSAPYSTEQTLAFQAEGFTLSAGEKEVEAERSRSSLTTWL